MYSVLYRYGRWREGGREGGVGGSGAPYDKDYLDRPSFQGAAYDR